MLSEFYLIFIFVVPVVTFIVSFSNIVDSRFKQENNMRKAVYSYFMKDQCVSAASCTDSKLDVEAPYKIVVRKPSKALKNVDKGGVEDGSLDMFYKEFEEKIKAATRK